VITSKTGH